MRRVSCGALSAIFLVVMAGCGGLSCPFQRPSCCDNVLFGCGTFDLPDGCSCSDYFVSSSSAELKMLPKEIAPMSRVPKVVRSTTGVWRLTARKADSAACPYLPRTIQKKVVVRESRGRAEMKVPGLLSLSGARSGNALSLGGERSIRQYGCRAKMSARILLSSGSSGSVRLVVENKCHSASLSCGVTYVGEIRR
jgi:hypothetical protein